MKYPHFDDTQVATVLLVLIAILFILVSIRDRKANANMPFWSWLKKWIVDDIFSREVTRELLEEEKKK